MMETNVQKFNLWSFLTRPHPRITDIEMKRQSALLAGLMLAIIVMVSVAEALLTIQNGQPSVVTLGGLVLTLVLYFLNRTGNYRWASVLFVAQNFLLIFVASVVTNDLALLLFASITIILSAMLLPPRLSVILFFVGLVVMIAIMRLHPMTAEFTTLAPTIVFFVTSPLILVFLNHRTQLEKERQAELREANSKLREHEALLEKRVEERTRELAVAKDEAEAARHRAEEADRLKSQFLASMSHELRTPLNAILNFSQIMSMGVLGPINDRQKTTLNEVVGSGKHLLALINDVLDMSKIQGGMLNLFLEENVSLNEVLDTVAGTAASLIGEKPVMLIRDEDALPPVLCDKRRIQQVLLNLISNAAKFTHDGTITVSAKCQNDQLLFAVIDTGPGIASKDKDIIFQPFQQTETGIQHAGGTGLGLPISRNLIEAHGGELWVESEAGRGAAFIFTLPLRSPKLQEMLHEQMGANHA